MKAIIEGKRYNTETAEWIASYHNGCTHSDFNYLSEDLYRTPRGNWFLAGEGGPMTTYARHIGNGNKSGSEKIIPFTEDDVIEWLERHDEHEVLEQYFPDYIQDA